MSKSKKTAIDLLDPAQKAAFEQLIQIFYDAIGDPLEPIKAPKVPKHHRPYQYDVEILAAFTDWHIGKKTETYNVKVMQHRLHMYEVFIREKLLELQPRVLHLYLGGDMVDNHDLFPGQRYEVELHSVQQHYLGAKLIAAMIRELSRYVGKIVVPCIAGNHGRIGRKGEQPYTANWDYLMYRLIAMDLKDHDRVEFIIPEHWRMIHKVANRPGLLMHGDMVAGSGTMNIISNSFLKWTTAILGPDHKPVHWDWAALGHFHTAYKLSVAGKTVYGNGTAVCGDGFAEATIKVPSSVSQKVLVVPLSPSRPMYDIDFPLL